jgi:HK97 family phage major capsid protein
LVAVAEGLTMPRVKAKNPVASKEFEASLGVTSDATMREADRARRHDAVLEEIDGGAKDVDAVYRRHSYRTSSGLSYSVKENSFYGVASPHSWFRDLALSATANVEGFTPLPHPQFGGPEEARARLQREGVTKESRTLSTTVTAGGNFTPPVFLYEQFATAVRSASVLPQLLPENTLPGEIRQEQLFTPRITTGATALPQNPQNTGAISSTDIVESMVGNPIATVAGMQDMSQQLVDHSNIDLVLAADLGRALGAQLDSQLISGTGTNSQALGLVTVTGITSTAYTDASPTQQECFVKILQACSDLAIALGKPADAILLHPRRSAWFRNWRDTATGIPAVIPWPAKVTDTPNIPTALGASTNEDFALVLRTDELPIYLEPPVFRATLTEVLSNTLTARFIATQYIAGLFTRRPEAIAKVSGTGFAGVVFS